MAILLDTSTGTKHALKPYHVFGRSAQHADCVLPLPTISLIHAYCRWAEPQWTLTDHSRNGSYVNGERLTKDQPTPLHVGDRISFGTPEAEPWQVIDDAAPADVLLPLSLGQHTITLAPFQNLPDDTAPQACIYRSAMGQWLKETAEGVTPLQHGDIVYIGRHAWRLMCAEERLNTLVPSRTVTWLKFETTLDEEHVYLTISRGRAVRDLGDGLHHYLLLLLARQRLADEHSAIGREAQGWMDFERLGQVLDMDTGHLNTQIFRLRREFESVVAQNLIQHDFIERRPGGIRLGDVGLEIWKGAELEGCSHHGTENRLAG
ncbi:MAG: FHA domain-containing protein [Aquabacterium sp.]